MSAVSAVLLALLIQLSGVELDTAREASLLRYDGGVLEARWSLDTRDSGSYRFVGPSGEIVVERLRNAELSYAVVEYGLPAVDSQIGELVPTLPVVAVATVSLASLRGELRPVQDRSAARQIDPASVVVAHQRGATSQAPETGGAVGQEGPEAPAGIDPDTAQAAGMITLQSDSGQWSASHGDSGEVLFLRTR
jgi:hypothetical protein